MDCCTGIARCLLIFFNIIFMISGIGVLAVGIFVIVDPDSKKLQDLIAVDSSDKYLKDVAYVLIGFGCFVLLVGLMGFLAGCKQVKAAIVLYIMFLVIIFIGELGGGIAAAVMKAKLEDGLQSTLNKALKQYNETNKYAVVTKSWDIVQKELHCCGVTQYTDYKNVTLTTGHSVPVSCCKDQKNSATCEAAAGIQAKDANKFLYTKGCLTEVKDDLKNNITILIGVAIGIAMIQLLGIVLACRVWRSNDDVEDSSRVY